MSIVFALATPPVKSAICIFRVSGKGCHKHIKHFFGLNDFEPKKFYLTKFKDVDVLIDKIGLLVFEGPESYTGEDSFEVYAHGSLGVMSLVVDVFKKADFDEAPPGEFTKRAFLNEKISLNEAESLSDLIDSTTSKEVFLSGSSLFGDLSERLIGFSDRINSARIRVEGEIDFSDEGELFMDKSLVSDLELLVEDFHSFTSLCANKRDVSSKKNVLLVGPTNSGKSSVFNRLVGYERAIVTDRPGTTRDMISSEAFFESSVFSIFDTAGVRETNDVIEEKGIKISLSQLRDADCVLGVFEKYDEVVVKSLKGGCSTGSFFTVQNKVDLNMADSELFDYCVSAKTGSGFTGLKKAIINYFNNELKETKSNYLIRGRHVKIFAQVTGDLESALFGLKNNKALELVAEDLKNSRTGLDELLGKKFSDSLLGDIFSSFCIGK
jgi:tRNA modification GTPase